METLNIGRFESRYRLSASSLAERERLDRLMKRVVEEALPAELNLARVSGEELVCLRTLYVPVGLRLGSTDSSIAAEWGRLLAAAIKKTVENGRDFVRYGSRAQALADLAYGVARGDLRRTWAWRQLGLWPTAGDGSEKGNLVDALTGSPSLIVPILRMLAGHELLRTLATRLKYRDWFRLSLAALEAAGGHRMSGKGGEETSVYAATALRLASRSPLFADFSAIARKPGGTDEYYRPLAALVLLDADPAFVQRPRMDAEGLMFALARRLASFEENSQDEKAEAVTSHSVLPSQTRRDSAHDGQYVFERPYGRKMPGLIQEDFPETVQGPRPDGPNVSRDREDEQKAGTETDKASGSSAKPPEAADSAALQVPVQDGIFTDSRQESFPTTQANLPREDRLNIGAEVLPLYAIDFDGQASLGHDFKADSIASEPASRLRENSTNRDPEISGIRKAEVSAMSIPDFDGWFTPDQRLRAVTRHGGLLFLLNLINALELPAEMLATPSVARRTLRWVLYRLALTLLPMKEDDPAALAFCGLPPGAEPPVRDEEQANAQESLAIEGWADRLTEETRQRLPDLNMESRPLMRWLCMRHAEIMADPGWIEARFSLDDVSTAIRKSGLDLNPDYLPWLGVVMRFHYG